MSGTQAKLNETSVTGVGQFNLEDANIQSSPFMSSSLPPRDDAEDIEDKPSVKVIALVREQDLEGKICSQDFLVNFSPSYERPMLPGMEY